jgi:signal transduction histidine kinase
MVKEAGYKMVGTGKSSHDEGKSARHQMRNLMKALEEVNRKLEEAESVKTNFLSNIRNEINNPLTSIMGLSEQILHGLHPAPDVIQKIADTIYSEAFDLDFQLRNIFVAAELEAGEQVLNISNVEVNVLIQNTIHSFQRKADKKKLKISYSYKNSIPGREKKYFKTDSQKLKLILSNLLCNAIEFSMDGGKIELQARMDDKYLVIILKDYGIGFDMKDQKTIFERFRQLDTGMRRKHTGHGLGLSITKDVVEFFGGTISVVSSKGKGSAFTVSVPEVEALEGIDVFSDDGNVFIF